ncbi:MAG: NAD(P)-dependent oxidoreductase [Phycisphaerales bacterium]|nr:NAD(P)-dependent oxidoreductase [Phycisphaerales bacterium]
MRIAITGVSGFIGSMLARHAARSGHDVTGLVRATSRRDHIDDVVDRFIVGDQADPDAWTGLLDGADVVIHNSVDWAAFKPTYDLEANLRNNLLGSIRFLHASAPRPFIFISTIAVHHNMRPRWNGRIDEDHPLRPGHDYGAMKAAIEAFLHADHAQTGRFVSMLRPCGVYGIDPNLERSIGYPIIGKLRDGQPFDRPGGGKFVHVDDVAAAAVACIDNDKANGHVFNLVDCYARWGDWASIVADELGVEAKIDLSSPPEPMNTFSKDATQERLGVAMDRGTDGIRAHIRELIAHMA